jgi:hypothetical protein
MARGYIRQLIRAGAVVASICASSAGLVACTSSGMPGEAHAGACTSTGLHVQHFLVSNEWPTVIYGLRLTNAASSSCTIPAEPTLAGRLSTGATREIKYEGSTPTRVVTIEPGHSASMTVTAINGCALPAGGDTSLSGVRITLGTGQALTIANWNQGLACGISAKPFESGS